MPYNRQLTTTKRQLATLFSESKQPPDAMPKGKAYIGKEYLPLECCVIGCDSSTEDLLKHYKQICPKHKVVISKCVCPPLYLFFNFPRGVPKRTHWLRLVNRRDPDLTNSLYQVTPRSRICSRHFLSGDCNGVPLLALGYEHPLSDTARALVYDKQLIPPIVKKIDKKVPKVVTTEEDESQIPDFDILSKCQHSCYGCKIVKLDTFTLLSNECQLAKIWKKICVIMGIKTIPEHMRSRRICRECMATLTKSFNIAHNIVDPCPIMPRYQKGANVVEQASTEDVIASIRRCHSYAASKPPTEWRKRVIRSALKRNLRDVIVQRVSDESSSSEEEGDQPGDSEPGQAPIPLSVTDLLAAQEHCDNTGKSERFEDTLEKQLETEKYCEESMEIKCESEDDDGGQEDDSEPDVVSMATVPDDETRIITTRASYRPMPLSKRNARNARNVARDVTLNSEELDNAEQIFKCPVCHLIFPRQVLAQHHLLSAHFTIQIQKANPPELDGETQSSKRCCETSSSELRSKKLRKKSTSSTFQVINNSETPVLETGGDDAIVPVDDVIVPVDDVIVTVDDVIVPVDDVIAPGDDVILPAEVIKTVEYSNDVEVATIRDGETTTKTTTEPSAKLTTDDERYACDKCQASFHLYRDLIKHYMYRHRKKAVPKYRTCPVCFKKISHHYDRHVSRCKVKCDVCAKTFTCGHYLRYFHMRMHANERAYVCDQCGASFNHPGTLREHTMRVHTGEKPYKCKFCQRKFLHSSELTLHTRRKHTGEKPYMCHLCSEAYMTLRSLKTHLYSKHGQGDEPKRRQHCTICGRSFLGKVPKPHMDLHEPEHGKFECEDCRMYFKNETTLKRHVRMRHGGTSTSPTIEPNDEDLNTEDTDNTATVMDNTATVMDNTSTVMDVVRDLQVQVVRASTSDAC